MKDIWNDRGVGFDPFGVGSSHQSVTPDSIRGYSNWCPSGTEAVPCRKLEARRRGLIPLLKPELDRLTQATNFFCAPELIETALRAAGEGTQ